MELFIIVYFVFFCFLCFPLQENPHDGEFCTLCFLGNMTSWDFGLLEEGKTEDCEGMAIYGGDDGFVGNFL